VLRWVLSFVLDKLFVPCPSFNALVEFDILMPRSCAGFAQARTLHNSYLLCRRVFLA
jgi:hypothetical protein